MTLAQLLDFAPISIRDIQLTKKISIPLLRSGNSFPNNHSLSLRTDREKAIRSFGLLSFGSPYLFLGILSNRSGNLRKWLGGMGYLVGKKKVRRIFQIMPLLSRNTGSTLESIRDGTFLRIRKKSSPAHQHIKI